MCTLDGPRPNDLGFSVIQSGADRLWLTQTAYPLRRGVAPAASMVLTRLPHSYEDDPARILCRKASYAFLYRRITRNIT